MERDRLESHSGSFPFITTPDGQSRDPGTERLLQDSTNDQAPRLQSSRFKSLHRPYASSYPEDNIDAAVKPADYAFPDDRGRKFVQPRDETTHGGRSGYAPIHGPSQLWNSFWLTKIVLICFLLLLAALLTGLLLVWYSNVEKDGFYVASSTSPHTWTYGPTAVLVIVISLWRMFDFHCKSLTPWDELRRGPVVASRSLLLDYLSPFQLSSLLRALRNGHIAVVATILGFVLLKALTIFSTGLFVLSTIPIFDSNSPVNTTTTFDSTLAGAFNGTSPLDSKQISNGPLYSWYGHLAHGLPYPPGSTADYVFQTFESAGEAPSNASLSAEVDAFVPSANCSVINVKLDGASTIQGFDNKTNTTNSFPTELSLLLPDGNICAHWSYTGVSIQNPLNYVTPSKQITGTYQSVFCSLTDPGSQIDLSKGPDAYLYTITEVEYTQKLFANATQFLGGSFIISNAKNTSRTVKNMANVLCLPHYTITKLNITNSTAAAFGQTRITKLPKSQNHTIPGFTARNLSSLFESTAQAAPDLFGNTELGDVSSASQVPSVMFGLLSAVKGSTDYSVFLNAQLLKSTAEDLFNGLTLEIVRQNLMGPDQTTIDGEAMYLASRLYIRPTSLWVMVAGFGLLTILTVLVLCFAPSAVVSRDPSSIAAHAAILTRSTDLNRELRKDTAISDRSLRSILAPHFYRASVVGSDNAGPVFKIQVQSGAGSASARNLIMEWWHPTTLSSLVILATVLLPSGVVIGLEVLQRASDRNNGLLTLPPDHFSEAYIHYVPALVMLLIATLFTALDFNVAIFSPFSALRSEYASSRRTMSSHLQGKTAPFALLEALRSLQFGAFLSLFGALVASMLIIVVSGLYSVQMLSSTGPTRTLDRLDVFNLSWANSYADDNGAAATLSLIEHKKLSYPNFVYAELVFPSFTLEDHIEGATPALSVIAGSATAMLPALRANLNCKILPESSFKISTEQAAPFTDIGADEAFVNAEFDLPPQCRLAGINRNERTLQYTNTFELAPKNEFVYAGAQLDIVFGNGSEGVNYGENLGAYTSDNPPGCPSLAFTFGRFRLNSTDRANVTTMVCSQEVQRVSARVILLANSTTIDTALVDEGSVTTLTNPLSDVGSTSFEYRIQNNLLNEMATFNGSGYVAAVGDVQTIDLFFQAVINGSDGVSEQDLVGVKNHANLIQAINRLYRKYMALAINANMRKPCPASGCPSDLLSKRQTSPVGLQATLSVSTPRLVQSATSKLILQILLAVMLVCGISAYLLTPMRNLLPCNPCTIAGTMALLAGSKLCWSTDDLLCECCGRPRTQDADSMIRAVGEVDHDHHEDRAQIIPHGAEWMSDSDLRAVFSRHRYTLGWWKRGYGEGKRGGGKRYGIDIGRADGLDDQDWELGRKRTRRYMDEERETQWRRSGKVPNWLMGPLKEEVQPPKPKPRIPEELEEHDVRQSRMPEWMLGPLKLAKGPEEHELQERRVRSGPQDGDLGTAQPQPQNNGAGVHQSRIPAWLMGPLKPDPQVEPPPAPAARPEAFASGGLRGPDAPGFGHQGA